MNRYSSYSTSDRYRQPSYDRYTSLSRSKSPYRSTSSLNSHASDANLKVEPNNFDALNKSLGRHDASFMDESSKSGDNSRYNSLKKGSSRNNSRFNVDKLNKDYSKDYGTGKIGKLAGDSSSSDYDLNNNYQASSYKPAKAAACASDSDDYELTSPTYRPSTYTSPYRSSLAGGLGASKVAPRVDKGDDRGGNDEPLSDYSDESMSEYIHCKTYCPDSVDDSKLFHGLRSSLSSPTPSSQSTSHSHSHQHHQPHFDQSSNLSSDDVHFVPVARIEDQQAIRAAEFHPGGRYFAVGSNSKLLRVFQYSSQDSNNNAADSLSDISPPELIYKREKYHKGSIYCLAWNQLGNLLATGSNDKTVKLIPFNPESRHFHGNGTELPLHDGTVRDVCFMDDLTNNSSLLLSGGAGDCKIKITDCETNQPFLSLSGHSGPVLSLYTWGGAMFVSGSQDKTIRFWDLRSNSCTNFVTCPTISSTKPGGAVASVSVDPSGKLLVSGHEDSTCMLYDIRGGRVIQTFHPHTADIRSIRFSNKAYYLLSGGYDNKIVLTNLQGDLTQSLKSVVVAEHDDKVIQCRWHPTDFVFLSTSADKTAQLWSLPD